jgi:hypothetical protein
MYLKVVPGWSVKPSHVIIFSSVVISIRISLNPFNIRTRLNEFQSNQKTSQLISFYQLDQVFRKEPFHGAFVFSYNSICENILDIRPVCQYLSYVISEALICTIFDTESQLKHISPTLQVLLIYKLAVGLSRILYSEG